MKARTAPLATALLLLASLAGVRLAMRADAGHVWLLGRLFGSACAFREHFGVPCPNCGMSRSIVLTMHGNMVEAMSLNPAGPLLVLGVLAAALLLGIAAIRSRDFAARRWVMRSALAYSGLYVAVLIGHWIAVIG